MRKRYIQTIHFFICWKNKIQGRNVEFGEFGRKTEEHLMEGEKKGWGKELEGEEEERDEEEEGEEKGVGEHLEEESGNHKETA